MSLPDITPKHRDVDVEGVGTISMRPLSLDEVRALLPRIRSSKTDETLDAMVEVLCLALQGTDKEIRNWVLGGDALKVQKVFSRVMAISEGSAEEEVALGN